MSAYSDFQKYVNDLEASSTFKSWCNLHGADCTTWKTYRTGVLTDTPPPSAPAMSTSFGKSLVDVGVMAIDAGLVVPPPPPPLTAAFSFSSSALVASFHDASTPGPSGPITAWHWDFGDGNTSALQNPTHTYAAAGTYTVALTVSGTPPDGTANTSHPINVVSSGGGSILNQFISSVNADSHFDRPAFTPVRTVRFWDKAGLDAAIAGMQAGDLIKYDPTFFGKPSQALVIASSTSNGYAIHDKNPASPVVIDLGCSHNVWDPSKITNEYVRFAYTGTQAGWSALLLYNISNLHIYGGEYDTGQWGGAAWRAFSPVHNCIFLGGYISSAGGSAVGTPLKTLGGAGGSGQQSNIYQFECNRYTLNPAQDPHPDRGTGQHGAILHGGGFFHHNYMAIYAHDPLRPGEFSAGKTWPEGAGGGVIEAGIDEVLDYSNNHFWAYGENCLMTPNGTNPGSTGIQHIGGWVILAYGHGVMTDNVYHFVGGQHMSGGVFNCNGSGTWYQTPVGHEIQVLVGRRNDVRRYPAGISAPNNVEYPSGFGIDWVDCT